MPNLAVLSAYRNLAPIYPASHLFRMTIKMRMTGSKIPGLQHYSYLYMLSLPTLSG